MTAALRDKTPGEPAPAEEAPAAEATGQPEE